MKEAGKLHQWKPGQSGNPKGNPKAPKLKALIDQYLEGIADPATQKTRLEMLAQSIVIGALKRESAALKELLARLYPEPAKDINLNATIVAATERNAWLDQIKLAPTMTSRLNGNGHALPAIPAIENENGRDRSN